jgi:hypothetical protein
MKQKVMEEIDYSIIIEISISTCQSWKVQLEREFSKDREAEQHSN